tara:strand:- start:1703 stop:3028 length:1326 start_codon:yes stop_codon:yes gene_type:complete
MSKVKKVKRSASVTLCMIVKDESHIIKECLESMLPYIDRYDITDTGSTDGTPELIKEFMDEHDIPGEVYLSDWKGFGDSGGKIGSRTESLRNCDGKADYAWVIDADDIVTGNFQYPPVMDQDCYTLRIGRGEDFTWWRNQIFKTGMGWHYVGVLHEYANCPKVPDQQKILKILGDYKIEARTEGARNVGITPVEKYSRDAEHLEEALKDEPDNSRYQFYLAQSYFDSQQFEKSLEAYSKRAEMGGWPEEVFYSLYRVGMIKAILDKPWEEIQQAFLDSWESRPTRAEPLYQIARCYRQIHNRPVLAYMYARMALDIPYPHDDILFVQDDVYKFGVLDEVGASAYYAGKPHIGFQACKRLVEEDLIPEEHKSRVVTNLKQYEQVLLQIHAQQAQMEVEKKQQEEMMKQKEKEQKREEKKQKAMEPKKSTKTSSRKGYKKRKA